MKTVFIAMSYKERRTGATNTCPAAEKHQLYQK